MVVLHTLLADPDLGLDLVTGEDPTGVDVGWAHVSELHDPTEFLEGGELLLVTGVNLPRGRLAQSEYVERLVAADVAALGYGVGVTRKTVPGTLLEACRTHGLPLVAIARAVPFLAITRAMARALAEEERSEREYVFAAQRRLTANAIETGGMESLVRGLVRTIGADGSWALLLDRAGEVVSAEPADSAILREQLADEIERVAGRTGAASLLTRLGDDEVWLQSLAVGKHAVGYLALGRDRPLSSRERQVVNTAVPLFVLAMNRSQALDEDRQGLETGVLELLLAGQHDLVERVATSLWNGLPAGPVQVVVCRASRMKLQSMRGLVATEPRLSAGRIVSGIVDDALVLLTPVGDRALNAVLAAVRSETSVQIGVSTPTPYDELARGLAEANRAAGWARTEQERVARFADLPPVSLLALVPDDQARDFVASWLRPLLGERGDLVASLRAWLEHHGQWDPAAADLGVHRHTLRNRVQKAEGLLDRRLDSADSRAELWLALQLHDRDEELGAG